MSQTKRQINRIWDEAERRKHGRQVKERFARDRDEKLRQANAVIDELLDQGITVSQNEVARKTGISVGFINKHLRGAIEQAKQRHRQMSQKPRTARSLATVEKDNERLKASNRRLHQELDKYRQINRELVAQVARVVDLEDEAALLRTQNRELLTAWRANEEKVVNLPTRNLPAQERSTQKPCSVSQIESELKALGIKLTSTLRKTIEAAPEETVLQAIGALKEALEKDDIRSPGGWLRSAIEGEWTQNESLQQQEFPYPEGFEDWYQTAVEAKFILDIPMNYLNLDCHSEPKVKVNRPGEFGAPYTEMPWRDAKAEFTGGR